MPPQELQLLRGLALKPFGVLMLVTDFTLNDALEQASALEQLLIALDATIRYGSPDAALGLLDTAYSRSSDLRTSLLLATSLPPVPAEGSSDASLS